MAAIDFPASPTPNQEFLAPNGITYVWDDVDGKWRIRPLSGITAPVQENIDTDAIKDTAGTVNKHEVVHITDWTTDGVPVRVEQADASSGTLMPASGISLEAFTDSADGRIGLAGILKEFNTSAWAEGDRLWVDPTSPGQFTNVRPTTGIIQDVGIVLEVGTADGAISYSFFQTDRLPATEVFYDNTTSELTADEVQAAIDELVAQPAGFRNVVINGGMNVWQRGTAFVGAASGTYSADRWQWIEAGIGVQDINQVAGPDPQFPYALEMEVTTANAIPGAADLAYQAYQVEAFDLDRFGFGLAGAKQLSVSLWLRATVTGIYCVSLRSLTGSRVYIKELTINAADTWEYKTFTLTADITGTWNRGDNSSGLLLGIAMQSGATFHGVADAWQAGGLIATANQVNGLANTGNKLAISGVTMELGTPKPFEFVDYQVELARCQRYFYRNADDGTTGRIALGQIFNTTQGLFGIHLPTTMRDQPVLTVSAANQFRMSNAAVSSVLCTTFLANTTHPDMVFAIFDVASGMVAGNASTLTHFGGYMDADAEL